MLPLGIAVLIVYMSPFWTSVLAYFFNGEPIYRKEYMSMAVCFIGVIGITFGGRHEETQLTEPETSPLKYGLGALAALCASFAISGGAVTNRKLHDVNIGILISFMALLAAVSSFSFFTTRYFVTGQTFLYYENSDTYFWVFGACMTELFNSVMAIIAYQSDSSAFVGLLSYACIIWGFLFDFLVYDKGLTFV
jgi:drug/metabolite transporter (DMT)-like permease